MSVSIVPGAIELTRNALLREFERDGLGQSFHACFVAT